MQTRSQEVFILVLYTHEFQWNLPNLFMLLGHCYLVYRMGLTVFVPCASRIVTRMK